MEGPLALIFDYRVRNTDVGVKWIIQDSHEDSSYKKYKPNYLEGPIGKKGSRFVDGNVKLRRTRRRRLGCVSWFKC